MPLIYEIALMKDEGVIQGRPYWATDWLKHYGQEKVAEVVTRIAAHSQSAQARTRASELAASWHLPGIDKLINAQLQSPDEAVRRSAVQTCGRFTPKDCFETLLGMADDKDELVRRYLSYSLAQYDDV